MKLTRRPGADSAAPNDSSAVPGKVLGAGFSASLVVGVILTIAVIVLAVQNTEDVHLEFLAWDANAPLVAILLAAVLIGVVFDEIVGLLWRHRRRDQITMKEELAQHRAVLREDSTPAEIDKSAAKKSTT